MLEGMLYILRTGAPWRDLPEVFGNWSSVYSRWRRWGACGLWEKILSILGRGARGTTRFIDSTHIKVHQHGSGPVGGQEAHGIGRTKGGLNTKITALVDSLGRAVSLSLHCGTRNDVKIIEGHICKLRGRTLIADKGFDSDHVRELISKAGGTHCIPRRRCCGGTRPFSRRLYRRRHRVENFFCRIKRHCRVSTRYEKLATTFLAFVQLATIIDWLKY